MPVKFNPFTGQLQIDEKGSGGGSSYIDGEVQNFSALPETLGSPAVDSAYLVREAEGAWLLNRKPAGIYIRTANTGTRVSDWTYAGEFPDVFNDANFVLYDNGDSTKNLQFQLSGISSGTTRTITVPDKNITLDDAGDSRTPTAHAASHASAGSDPLAPSDIGLGATDSVAFGSLSLGILSGDSGSIDFSTNAAEFQDENGAKVFSWSTTALDVEKPIGFTGAQAATNASTTRTNLGLGDSATADIGTGSTEVAAGDHGHGNITSDGKIGSTAGLPLVTTTAGAVTTLALGTAGQVLTVNSGANGVEFAAAASGGGGSKTYAVFSAEHNQPPSTAFATLDTRNSIAVLDFDDATDESAVFVSIIPEAASLGSGLKIRLHWMATTATSGNVVWDVSLERMTTDLDSDSFDTIASGTAAANGTSGILTVTEITLTTIDSVTAGDGFRLKVTRDANNASDTMTGDAELVAVEVRSAA